MIQKQIIPNRTYNFGDFWLNTSALELARSNSIHLAVNWLGLKKLVYGFEWTQAQKYFKYNKLQTQRASDSLPESSNNLTVVIDLLAIYTESNFIFRRSIEGIQDMDLDHTRLHQLYKQLGPEYFDKVALATINSILIDDQARYLANLDKTQRTIVVIICISLVSTNVIIVLAVLIQLKISKIYSTFYKLYRFEIDNLRFKIYKLSNILRSNGSAYRIGELLWQQKAVNKLTEQYLHSSKRKRSQYFQGSIHGRVGWIFSKLFNLVLLNFVLLQGFNVFAYIQLRVASNETNYKLNQAKYNRMMGTTSSSIHSVFYRTYLTSLRKAGLGTTYFPQNQTGSDSIRFWFNIMNNFVPQIEAQYGYINESVRGDLGLLRLKNTGPCEVVDLKSLNMTQDQCRRVADGTFGRSGIEVLRWIRMFSMEMLAKAEQQSGPQLVEYLKSSEFQQGLFVRNYFVTPYLISVAKPHLDNLIEYHESLRKTASDFIYTVLVIEIIIIFFLDIFGYLFAKRQISISLNSLKLIPSEVFQWNPNVAAIANRLT